ncbi:MAG: FAD-dependent oxidoreductase, partial [Thermoleophilia bacterium]|nr:FAD-dependent oxidoreductase [Thermoleophilia bacterium]
MNPPDHLLPVAIIGSGPTGIDAALGCLERGLSCVVLEQGDSAAAGVRQWGHVQMFTPWARNLSDRIAAAMAQEGIAAPPPERRPTGAEFVNECLAPLAAGAYLRPLIMTGTRVLHVGREGVTKEQEIGSEARARRPFRLIVSRGGEESVVRARAVIDCSGARALPNSLGDAGIPAPGEGAHDWAIAREIPDVATNPSEWASLRVLLAGAGHSAQTAARALAPLVQSGGGHLTWVVRDTDPDWGAVEHDPLPARAALAEESHRIAAGVPAITVRRGTVVESLRRSSAGIALAMRTGAGHEEIEVDRVLALTGRVGDHTLYRQLQVQECYATAGPMALAASLLGGPADCLAQAAPSADVLRNPEPGFFLAG